MDGERDLIIADDLSGAADCALGYGRAGADAVVLLDAEREPPAADAVAIDADTRRLPPAEAARIQRRLFERHAGAGARFYKKMDSTLRGNVVAETAALLPRAGMAVIAPAFPGAGRTTRGGRQFVHGTPLIDTDIWRGEGKSGPADLPAMLAAGDVHAAVLELDAIRETHSPLGARLDALAAAGVQAVVCDAQTDDDLARIARAYMSMTAPAFGVGSAGFSNRIAALRHPAARDAAPPRMATAGAIVTVVGSFAEASRRQAAALRATGMVASLSVPTAVLLGGPAHPAWRQAQQRLRDAVDAGDDLLLAIDAADPVRPEDGLALCRSLAALLAPLAARIGALALTGGETARAVLSAIGTAALRPLREIEAGIPLSFGCGAHPIPIVTKAGSFGRPDTLIRCHELLRAMRAAPSRFTAADACAEATAHSLQGNAE